jgi:phosphoribosyl 1,2-cyclic phosphodiesterase
VELTGSDDVILLDGGTGIRAAGREALARGAFRFHVFLTHFHWDHIQGLPFFEPLFRDDCQVRIYASAYSAGLREALTGLMAAPYFPVPWPAQVELVEIAGAVDVAGVRVRPFEVWHPQGACAYRVDGESSFVYAPDREHGDARLDGVFAREVRGAKALVLSAQYTPEEYESHRGWGHSTWVESTRVAQAAGAESLILFHHDPWHGDDVVRGIEAEARGVFPNTFAAKEDWAFEL